MNISSLSVKELLHRVNIAHNAVRSIPELQQVLKTFSWDEAQMQTGQDLGKQVLDWIKQQQNTQEKAQEAQKVYQDAKRSVDALYKSHIRVARFVYANDRIELKKLMLIGPRATRYSGWLEQVRVFYALVDQKALAKYGLLKEEISQVQQILDKLLDLEVLRNQAKWQAQQATDNKNDAVVQMRNWYRRFIQIARLACVDNPQLLESIGLIVKA
jgi:predicted XRE-type DNA-binding protein